jgi:hypothetical protein
MARVFVVPIDLEHRPGEQAGIPQIPGQRRRQPGPITRDDGLVEAVQLAQALGVRRSQVRIGADHDVDRVAGHEPDQPIDQERHEQQDGSGFREALQQEAGHGPGIGDRGSGIKDR